MTLQQQFRELARIMVTIEETVPKMEERGEMGMPVKSVDMFCTALGVTARGAELLVAMLKQSDKVAISQCQQWVQSKAKDHVVIDALCVEVN